MTPNGNFTNGDMGENRGHSGGMYENYYLHISITPAASSHNVTPVVKEACQA